MASNWIEVRVSGLVNSDELLGLLSDEHVRGAWQEQDVVHLYWSPEQWHPEKRSRLEAVVSRLSQQNDTYEIVVDQVQDRDWNEQWSRSAVPVRVGRRVVVRLSWHEAALEPGDIELILDPKQAFGTGHHATTQLMIEQLEESVQGGESVLDVGTGSGILAMVALRLGACRALGIDHDPVAVACASEYRTLNRFGPELLLVASTLGAVTSINRQPFDVVMANLDAQTALANAESLSALTASRGVLMLSGLLATDRKDVTTVMSRYGRYPSRVRERDGWIAMELLVSEVCDGEVA